MENRPFILVWLNRCGGQWYQCEAEHTQDSTFSDPDTALAYLSKLLEEGTISMDAYNKVLILNTDTGETHQYKITEQPKRYIANAI